MCSRSGRPSPKKHVLTIRETRSLKKLVISRIFRIIPRFDNNIFLRLHEEQPVFFRGRRSFFFFLIKQFLLKRYCKSIRIARETHKTKR